jgi:hypothetical protein
MEIRPPQMDVSTSSAPHVVFHPGKPTSAAGLMFSTAL